jgi:choline/glycine/proline betaine transport protein
MSEMVRDEDCLRLSVPHEDRGTFSYTIRIRGFRRPTFSWMECPGTLDVQRHYWAVAHSSEGETPVDVTGMTRVQLSESVVNHYAHFRHVRRIA